jgi:hypothetical protein
MIPVKEGHAGAKKVLLDRKDKMQGQSVARTSTKPAVPKKGFNLQLANDRMSDDGCPNLGIKE